MEVTLHADAGRPVRERAANRVATRIRFAILAIALCTGGVREAVSQTPSPAAEASEWIPLYKGNFDDFRIYFRGQGYIEDPAAQDVFVAEPGQIHVRKGTNGLLVTKKEYSHYHARVQYRWGQPDGSMNAGIMPHTDVHSTVVKDNRPRSIEVNMLHKAPGSIWLASKLGPFGYTYVEAGTKNYLPQEAGGVRFDVNPFGARTVFGRYKNDELPTKPPGEWNTMEVIVRGSESLAVIVNGQEVVRLFDIRLPAADAPKPGEPLTQGGIGLQSEGQEIFYRNFEIKLLKP